MTSSRPDSASNSTPQASPLKRRGILLGAGATVAAGAVAALASRTLAGAEAQPEVLARHDEGSAGYRLTEHVRRYYETTRI